MPGRTRKPPANDNAPRTSRRVVNALPRDLPITETELRLVETYFAAIIEKMLVAAANDNAPPGEKKGEA